MSESARSNNRTSGPVLQCRPVYRAEFADLARIQGAFADAAACEMRQAWRAELEPDFAPGTVRVGWHEERLLVLAELSDADISNDATANDQRMWELGDTFEMFLQRAGRPEYCEFHVTPNNHQLALRFQGPEAVQRVRATGQIAECLVSGCGFDSRTWVEENARKWFVYARIPALVVTGQSRLSAGDRWRFSFGRYDRTRGRIDPVISSTSPHTVLDFHRPNEWGEMIFASATNS